MSYASRHWVKDKMRSAFKFSKTMTLTTKDRSLRERWHSKGGQPHYVETWDESTYFSICYHPSADLNKHHENPGLTSQGQLLSCQIHQRRRKKWPVSTTHFPWIIKMQPTQSSGQSLLCLPIYISHLYILYIFIKHTILINLFLAYHLVFCWIPVYTETQRTWTSISPDTRRAILI